MDDEWSDLELMGAKLHDLVPWTSDQKLERPIINPARIAQAMGIRVKISKEVEAGDAKICFDETNNRWVILVRSKRFTSEMRLLIAHELGEWQMKRTGYPHWNLEHLCDAFAFVLLMPAELLRPRLGGNPWADLPRLADAFDVPPYGVAVRLALFFDVPTAVIDRGEILRVNDWGTSTSDEWLRDVEDCRYARVVEYDRLRVVVKK